MAGKKTSSRSPADGWVEKGARKSRIAPSIKAVPWNETGAEAPRVRQLLNRREQRELADIASVVDLPRNAGPLFVAGENAAYLYSVDRGIVRVLKEIVNGERQVLAFMFPGDLLGLAEAGRYINSAEAVTDCRFYRYPIKALERLLARDPLLDLHLLVKASHELRAAQRILSVIARQEVCDRLVCFLALLMRHPSLYDRNTRRLTIPMSRFDMADYLATAPETLARCLRRLEQQGRIRRIESRLIEMVDVGFIAAFDNAL